MIKCFQFNRKIVSRSLHSNTLELPETERPRKGTCWCVTRGRRDSSGGTTAGSVSGYLGVWVGWEGDLLTGWIPGAIWIASAPRGLFTRSSRQVQLQETVTNAGATHRGRACPAALGTLIISNPEFQPKRKLLSNCVWGEMEALSQSPPAFRAAFENCRYFHSHTAKQSVLT